MKDIVRKHFSLSTFMLEVVLKLPDNPCHGLPLLARVAWSSLRKVSRLMSSNSSEKEVAPLKWRIQFNWKVKGKGWDKGNEGVTFLPGLSLLLWDFFREFGD